MPFVKEKFHIEEPIKAFVYVMRTLGYTQAESQRHIAKGRILIDGESMFRPGNMISGEIEMVFFKPSPKGKKPLFSNKDFMVFEKPSGVLVHPNAMVTPYSMLDEIRNIAGKDANATHRIDMETSGLLLASKHKKAENYLKSSFEHKKIKKSYLAWADGKITESFSVTAPIKVNDDYCITKHKVFIDEEQGKASHTDFVPLKYDERLDATLVACYPLTGRTHQIRVHLFHVKHPILGDPIYGATFKATSNYLDLIQTPQERLVEHGASRLLLHAQSLTFEYGTKFYIESREDFEAMKCYIHPKEERKFNQ